MNTRQELQYRQALIDGIQKFAYMEPLIPINTSCSPPPLLNSEDIRRRITLDRKVKEETEKKGRKGIKIF